MLNATHSNWPVEILLMAMGKLSTLLLGNRIGAFFSHSFSLGLPGVACSAEILKDLTFHLCFFFPFSFPQTSLFLLFLYSAVFYLPNSTVKSSKIFLAIELIFAWLKDYLYHLCRVWYCNRRSWRWRWGWSWLDWRCCHPTFCYLCCTCHCLQWLEQGEAISWTSKSYWAGAEVYCCPRWTGYSDPSGRDSSRWHCTGEIW